MKYQFIEEHKHEFAIAVMCSVLTVSESGFYAWRKRPTCQRKREDAHLTQEIWQVFETHQGRYGAPRIHRDLHEEGITCSRKRVAQILGPTLGGHIDVAAVEFDVKWHKIPPSGQHVY